jgi:hypothetical protein
MTVSVPLELAEQVALENTVLAAHAPQRQPHRVVHALHRFTLLAPAPIATARPTETLSSSDSHAVGDGRCLRPRRSI